MCPIVQRLERDLVVLKHLCRTHPVGFTLLLAVLVQCFPDSAGIFFIDHSEKGPKPPDYLQVGIGRGRGLRFAGAGAGSSTICGGHTGVTETGAIATGAGGAGLAGLR